jgi:hypothetical protein
MDAGAASVVTERTPEVSDTFDTFGTSFNPERTEASGA